MNTINKLLLLALILLASQSAAQKVKASPFEDLQYSSQWAAPKRTTPPPIGYRQFCTLYANECYNTHTNAKKLTLNGQLWQTVERVNRVINETIVPQTDDVVYGTQEYWTFPTTAGDCEDYVLLKRKELIAHGVPRENLLITVVRDHNGDGHAVLTLVTDQGDFILDNQDMRIKRWDRTGYQFIKRQSQSNQQSWVALDHYGLNIARNTASR